MKALRGPTLSLTPFETMDREVVWICGNDAAGRRLEASRIRRRRDREAGRPPTTVEPRYLPAELPLRARRLGRPRIEKRCPRHARRMRASLYHHGHERRIPDYPASPPRRRHVDAAALSRSGSAAGAADRGVLRADRCATRPIIEASTSRAQTIRFYHARRILDAAVGSRGFYEFDERLQVPDGTWIPWPWAYDYLMSQAAAFASGSTRASDPHGVHLLCARRLDPRQRGVVPGDLPGDRPVDARCSCSRCCVSRCRR